MRKKIGLLDINEIYRTKTFHVDKIIGLKTKFVHNLVLRLVFGQAVSHH